VPFLAAQAAVYPPEAVAMLDARIDRACAGLGTLTVGVGRPVPDWATIH
jgi:hypothetical protein